MGIKNKDYNLECMEWHTSAFSEDKRSFFYQQKEIYISCLETEFFGSRGSMPAIVSSLVETPLLDKNSPQNILSELMQS